MADLEDFFAKRDKKKKKAPKFEADDVAKILEKKRVDMGKSSYQPSAESTDPVSEYKAQEDDDEWREAVEHTPDFTGLKIQDLVEENSEDEENETAAEAEAQKEGPWKRPKASAVVEPVAPPQPIATPTAIPIEPQAAADAGDEAKTPEVEKVIDAAPAPASKYVPIHLRNKPAVAGSGPGSAPSVEPAGKYVPIHLRGQSGSSGSSSSTPYRPKKTAPNIDDKNFFPSLGEC